MTKRSRKLIISIAILIIFIVFLVVGLNTSLKTTEYTYSNPKIPAEFDGFKIVQISDYHNEDFGDNQESFISAVANAEPDIIVLTGDIVDEDHPDIIAASQMVEGMVDIAPTYYITGNHELYPDAAVQYEQFQQIMMDSGVIHLDNKTEILSLDGADIMLTGQQYVSYYVPQHLLPADESYFNILLYHGSDNFDLIAPFGYDLVLAGHVHGGIVRLPFVGGLFDNTGGLFPEYDAGIFHNGNSTLIVNVGVGDADLPRFFNQPEIVVVTLNSGEQD